MESVSFDGVTLTSTYTVLSDRGVSPHEVETVSVSGRDGVVVRGSRLGVPPVSLVIVTDSGSRASLLQARRDLASLLDVREPKRLQFGGDGGLYYMALPDGDLDWAQFMRTGRLRVPFLVPSPAMYGAGRTATIPSAGSVTVEVGGTYPTSPIIRASNAVRSSGTDGVWGVSLDNADHVHVMTGSSSSRAVVIDCEGATCTVAGAVKVPTLDSDWLVLEPGTHVLRNDYGSGSSTVEWVERWL